MRALVNTRELKRRVELEGLDRTLAHLSDALEQRHLAPEGFSLRGLFESLVVDRHGQSVGGDLIRECFDLAGPQKMLSLLESTGAVDSTAFSNITGQLIYSKIMQGFRNQAFVLSNVIPNLPTRLSGEKIPGISRIGDQADEVAEGGPYPVFGFGEEYIETPETTKRGLIVAVTREAIFFDRTGLILRRAGEVGEFLGLNKEKRLVDVVIGAVNNYSRNGVASNTYLTAGGYINDQSNELQDWTSVEAAELLLSGMSDPVTGEPILLTAAQWLVMPAKKFTALRITDATEVTGTVAYQTTSGSNPLAGLPRPMVSELAYRRVQSELAVSAADAQKYWFYGDFQKAFAYMENWPITVVQAPAGSEAEFANDIVLRWRASERGAAAVLEPRYITRNKN